jgi:hypothetical protein
LLDPDPDPYPGPNPDPDAPLMTLPPLHILYETAQAAIDTINDLVKEEGFAFVRKRSKKTKSGDEKKVVLQCDRGGRYVSRIKDEDRKRKTRTKAISCPFQLSIRRTDDSGQYCRITVENDTHTHEPSMPTTHQVQRQRELLIKKRTIVSQLHLQIPTRQIITSIRDNDPGSCLLPVDINNLRMKLHREFLNGRTPIQALLMELPKDGEWLFRTELDDDNHVVVLFGMHKTSITMLKYHPWVLSMDCTYKTNMYGLPLLDIVGFTATGASVYLGFAFIANERQPTYETVLEFLAEVYEESKVDIDSPSTILTDKEPSLINAINAVFPETNTIICIWHINMNLMKKALPIIREQIALARKEGLPECNGLPLPASSSTLAKKQLDEALLAIQEEGWSKMMKRWNRLIYAPSQAKFDTEWTNFRQRYKAPIFAELLAYLQKEWIDDCPENFLRLHTDQYLHLGEAATSRTEASHWLLKQDLHVSTKDLLAVLDNFKLVVDRQFTKNKALIADERIKRPTKKLHAVYEPLIHRVSLKAISYVIGTYDTYLPPAEGKPTIPPGCYCNSKNTAGYPCIHLIMKHLDDENPFSLAEFHPQWHLYKLSDALPVSPHLLVQDPHRVRRRGRPAGRRNNVRSQPSQLGVIQVPATQQSALSAAQSTAQRSSSTDPLTPLERSTQREPSAFEHILTQTSRGGRGGRGAVAVAVGG